MCRVVGDPKPLMWIDKDPDLQTRFNIFKGDGKII